MKCNKQEHDCHLGLFTKMPLGQLDLHNLSNLLEKKRPVVNLGNKLIVKFIQKNIFKKNNEE